MNVVVATLSALWLNQSSNPTEFPTWSAAVACRLKFCAGFEEKLKPTRSMRYFSIIGIIELYTLIYISMIKYQHARRLSSQGGACGAVTLATVEMVGKEKKMGRRELVKEGKAKLKLVHSSTFRTAVTSQRSQTPASRARGV
jgi:hypothetical protein